MQSPTTAISRRHFLAGGSALGAVAILPVSAKAQGCNAIARILTNAQSQYDDPSNWALTLDPAIIRRMQQQVAQMRQDIAALSGVVSANRRRQLLSYAELIGNSAVLLTGFAVGFAPAIIASVALSGGILVARTLIAPEQPKLGEVLTNVAGSRIPVLIEAGGESAIALSRNAARYGRAAGALTSVGFLAYGFWDFAERTDEFQASTAALQQLKDQLEETEKQLQTLSDQAQLQRMRRDCARAIIEDLSPYSCWNPG